MSQEHPAASPGKRATILVASDVCPTSNDEALFESGDAVRLLGGYYEMWSGADFSVTNLECPLTESTTRIEKIGPNLKASPKCAAFFRDSRPRAICLANNHILDYGGAGVMDTLQACQAAGLATVGAGATLEEARTPLYFTAKGIRVGVIAMAEREFNIAGSETPGANPIDYRNFTMVKETRARTDFLLVLVHGGTEMFQYPRPGLVELCRFLVEQGAGAVIVQHSHCVGCWETYRGAPILYGQGNGIFANPGTPVEKTDPNWFIGMFVELQLGAGGRCEMQFHPYEQSRGFAGVRPLAAEARDEFMRGLEERSRVLQEPSGLSRTWKSYCKSRRRQVNSYSLGITGLLASVDYRIPFSHLIHSATNVKLRRNLVNCESHRELLLECFLPNGDGAHRGKP